MSGDQNPTDVSSEEALFLGTLASELVVDTPLHGAFATAYTRFLRWRSEYLEGRLSPEELGEQLADLRVLDDAGGIWTLGASTGRWYYRRAGGSGWTPGPTPTSVGVLVDRHGDPIGDPSQSEPAAVEEPDATDTKTPSPPQQSVESLFGTAPAHVPEPDINDPAGTFLTFDDPEATGQ